MSKLSSLFHFRNQLTRRKLCAQGMSNTISFPSFISTAGSAARQTFSTEASGKLTSRVFAEYSVYKGKAALTAKPVLPTFSRTNSGDLKLDRQGIILLTISPAIGERKYDWEKKQYFALSPTEIGSLISLESTNSCEFFHDPSMKSSNAGKVRKSLSIRPHDGGYFFQLSVVNNILKSNDRFTIPITTAEFAVMRTAFSFALPHLMGWDQFTNQIPGTVQESSSKVVPASLDSEWNQ